MPEDARDILNRFYQPIVDKSRTLATALERFLPSLEVTKGFFNGHYHKDREGRYLADAYPIVVISIMGLCDIEMDFDAISVTTKVSKVQAQLFCWKNLQGIPFEVYGVEDYLMDYGSDQTAETICEKIRPSKEKEFFVSLCLPTTAGTDDVTAVIKTLRSNEFYY